MLKVCSKLNDFTLSTLAFRTLYLLTSTFCGVNIAILFSQFDMLGGGLEPRFEANRTHIASQSNPVAFTQDLPQHPSA